MHRIGLSCHAALSTEEVLRQFIEPLRAALEASGGGIYSNYLRRESDSPESLTEHVLVFEVRDFKSGLRQLREVADRLNLPTDAQWHNLDRSTPSY